jgi:hypothetical protein
MDLSRILQTVINSFIRQIVNIVVRKGVTMAASKLKPDEQLTEADRAVGADARALEKRARQSQRATRRLF